jgi:hypothetical protein
MGLWRAAIIKLVPTAQAQPKEQLVIYRSADLSGATYALSPQTRRRLRETFGDALHLPPRVFIAHDTEADLSSIHGSLRPQIVRLLTGLPEERLKKLGAVRFQDPVTEVDFGSWSPAHP